MNVPTGRAHKRKSGNPNILAANQQYHSWEVGFFGVVLGEWTHQGFAEGFHQHEIGTNEVVLMVVQPPVVARLTIYQPATFQRDVFQALAIKQSAFVEGGSIQRSQQRGTGLNVKTDVTLELDGSRGVLTGWQI